MLVTRLFVFVSALASSQTESPMEIKLQEVLEQIKHTDVVWNKQTEAEVDRVVAKLGTEMKDVLLQQLESADITPDERQFIHLWIGKIGGDDVEERLIKEIEKPLAEEVSAEEYQTIYTAMYGLGFSGSEPALRYLQSLMTDAYWLRRNENPVIKEFNIDEEGTKRTFGQQAFNAIALSGNETALRIMMSEAQSFPEYFRAQLDFGIRQCYQRLYKTTQEGPVRTH